MSEEYDPRKEAEIMQACWEQLRSVEPAASKRILSWLRACLKVEHGARAVEPEDQANEDVVIESVAMPHVESPRIEPLNKTEG